MGKILELPKSSSHLLTSTQIITSVYCVVKELIENALDSGAKNVEVKLEDYGVERIEVKDNGCGIDKNDIPLVAKSHFTSKISSYSDLDKVFTYGFRGEALGAVCAVTDLVITTKSSEESIGSVSNFGHDGQIISTKPCPCVQGTTVSVLNLFKNIPVRKQFYRSEKNKKDELRKVEDLLISYGCIQHGIRFALYHNRNLIWQKSAVSSPKNALIQILGNSVMDHMAFIEYLNEQTQRKLELYLPKLNAPSTCGSNTSSRCITAVNQRPVRIKALDKLLKEYYNKSIQNLGKTRYPICFISVTVPLMEVDVNIEPNKTSVMLHNSEEILAQLSELLKSFYCCDRVTEDNPNVNNVPNKNPSMGKEEISNASDFLTSLKTNCELKTQQSKLNFVSDCVKITNSRQINNSMQKEDITRISEPCKKKLKTNIRSTSKDINSHIASLRDFFANEDENNSNHAQHASDFITNASRVTVQRNCGIENISKISGDLSNVCDASDSITSASRVTLQRDCGIENISKISENLSNVCDASDSITSAPRVTVQRNCGIENMSKASGDLSNVSNTHCDKITTFAVSSNLCTQSSDNSSVSFQDKNISGASAQFPRDFDGSNRNNFGINRSLSSVNDTCSDRITLPLRTALNTDRPIPAEESCASKPSVKCNESAVKNSVINNNGQSGDLWSRGIHPSGDFVQPVAVLQPKVTITPESNQRQANNAENCKKSSPNNQKNLSFERKLTAFDIFCRSNRLEVAAQNPEFSNHQIAQILSEKWNRLSSEEKAVYKNMLNKDYRKDIKKKERLGRTISQNLSQDKKEVSVCKKLKKKQFRPKLKCKDIKCSIEEIRSCFLNKDSCKKHIEDMNIINSLAPGIWVCIKTDKLILLNTFRLQETIIYHRLLETFQFDTEPLEAPIYIPTSDLGDDAMAILMHMSNLESNNDGIRSQYLIPNGFDVRLIKGDNNETAVELLGITKVIAFYGIADLKEILLLIKEKGCSAKLSECRPGKIILYLQSEANRMCRRSPPCQRMQDVKDLLLQKESLLSGCSICIHHKPFCQEIWDVQRNEKCTA